MRFVDANIFIYAFLKPAKQSQEITRIKSACKDIIKRINNGEDVSTSVVHLSEVMNILENRMSIEQANRFLRGIITKENIWIYDVTPKDYLLASGESLEKGIGINDALTLVLMKRDNLEEVYSFDTHFDGTEVTRVIE